MTLAAIAMIDIWGRTANALVFLAVATAIGAGWYLMYAQRRSLRPGIAEGDLEPVYLERAGARFDKTSWTAPNVRIATFDNFVVISCVAHEFVLRRGDVTKIERQRPQFSFVSMGLRLHHHRQNVPAILVLFTRDPVKLEAALRASLMA
jgi:hypothetical protein